MRTQCWPHASAPPAANAYQTLLTDQLSNLMTPLDQGWKARGAAELAPMVDLYPIFTKRAAGRNISRLSAYEQ
jgi:hypothetical protein